MENKNMIYSFSKLIESPREVIAATNLQDMLSTNHCMTVSGIFSWRRQTCYFNNFRGFFHPVIRLSNASEKFLIVFKSERCTRQFSGLTPLSPYQSMV